MAHPGWGANRMVAAARSDDFGGHVHSESSGQIRQAGRAFVNSLVERGAVGRVYEDVKEKILSGELGFKERLDVEALARRHRVSATPVRQALAYLAFERLLVAHPARGFEVKLWSERGLQELYEWRGQLAVLAAAAFWAGEGAFVGEAAGDHAAATATLFSLLHRDANAELINSAANADERLYAARLVEPEAIEDCDRERGELERLMQQGEAFALKVFLDHYHARRVDAAAKIRMLAALRSYPGGEE